MSQIIYRDKQHAFDVAVKHLRTMTERAVDHRGQCIYYYQKDGKVRRCAIGGIMTIEQAKLLEGTTMSIDWILTDKTTPLKIQERFQNVSKDFLANLQSLHDDQINWDENGIMESAIESFAHQHFLTYTP